MFDIKICHGRGRHTDKFATCEIHVKLITCYFSCEFTENDLHVKHSHVKFTYKPQFTWNSRNLHLKLTWKCLQKLPFYCLFHVKTFMWISHLAIFQCVGTYFCGLSSYKYPVLFSFLRTFVELYENYSATDIHSWNKQSTCFWYLITYRNASFLNNQICNFLDDDF